MRWLQILPERFYDRRIILNTKQVLIAQKNLVLNVLPKTMYLGFMIISTRTKDTLKTGDMPINLCLIFCGAYDTKSK